MKDITLDVEENGYRPDKCLIVDPSVIIGRHSSDRQLWPGHFLCEALDDPEHLDYPFALQAWCVPAGVDSTGDLRGPIKGTYIESDVVYSISTIEYTIFLRSEEIPDDEKSHPCNPGGLIYDNHYWTLYEPDNHWDFIRSNHLPLIVQGKPVNWNLFVPEDGEIHPVLQQLVNEAFPNWKYGPLFTMDIKEAFRPLPGGKLDKALNDSQSS